MDMAHKTKAWAVAQFHQREVGRSPLLPEHELLRPGLGCWLSLSLQCEFLAFPKVGCESQVTDGLYWLGTKSQLLFTAQRRLLFASRTNVGIIILIHISCPTTINNNKSGCTPRQIPKPAGQPLCDSFHVVYACGPSSYQIQAHDDHSIVSECPTLGLTSRLTREASHCHDHLDKSMRLASTTIILAVKCTPHFL